MKIAVVTDDGTTVAQHFGRARYYRVYEIENGTVVDDELRDRTATLHHGGRDHDEQHGHHTHHGGRDHDEQREHHGHGNGAADRHAGMIEQITDVRILIAGGMGYGARQALADAGIEVVATDERQTDGAVGAWLAGSLQHRADRLH